MKNKINQLTKQPRIPTSSRAPMLKMETHTKVPASISNDSAVVAQLQKDPTFAAEYLKAAFEDSDEPQILVLALRHIAEARGGIAEIAKSAGIKRESLYRALSSRGNPRLSTLLAVTKAVGLRLTLETTPA